MRVVITLPWGQRLGGAEAMLQAVLDGAGESGHELELVFFEGGPWPRELAAAGFRVEVIPAGHLRQVHRWLATVLRLAALLRRRAPDLVLNWAAKTQLYGAPAATLAGMGGRVVWWQQGIPDGFWLDRCATLLPARAIGCYSEAAARAQRQLRPRRGTFVVAAGAPVPDSNGHRTFRGAPAPVRSAGGRHRRPTAAVEGSGSAARGAQRCCASAATRSHLAIVGGDAYGLSTEYAASLPGLAGRLGLTDAVTFTGQVPDAGPYIEQMDVLVNASDPEPFGIVLLEGMARGVPVVAVDSGGPAEFIEDGRTGVLARSGEPDALADALERLLRAAPESRRAIGEAGRERFLTEFTDGALRARFFNHLETLARQPAV